MTKALNSWSVKGVSEEARALAKQAAAEAGLSLGQWINQTLMQQTEKKTKDSAPLINSESTTQPPLSEAELQKAIAVIDQKLQRLEGKMQHDLTILHRKLCRMEEQVTETLLAKQEMPASHSPTTNPSMLS